MYWFNLVSLISTIGLNLNWIRFRLTHFSLFLTLQPTKIANQIYNVTFLSSIETFLPIYFNMGWHEQFMRHDQIIDTGNSTVSIHLSLNKSSKLNHYNSISFVLPLITGSSPIREIRIANCLYHVCQDVDFSHPTFNWQNNL